MNDLMLIAKVKVERTNITITELHPVTSGMVGAYVLFDFDKSFADLQKTAVFFDGKNVTRDVIIDNNRAEIPSEVLASYRRKLYLSVYAFDSDGNPVMPTQNVCLGPVCLGANPSGDPGTDPDLPIWGQISAKLDNHVEDNNNPHNVTAAQTGAIPTAEKGAPDGVATLGPDGKVPEAQLPPSGGGGVSQEYVDQQDEATLAAANADAAQMDTDVLAEAKRYTDNHAGKQQIFTAIITNEVGRLVCDMTASEIIDASRKGVVKAEYTDEATGETREYYYFKQMPDGRAVFTKDGYIENGVPKQTLFYVDFAGNVTAETREPTAVTCYATCNAEAAPAKTVPVTWYVPKTLPRPSGNVGMMIDVYWRNGRADGIGYDVSLVWGEEGGSDNETIVPKTSTTLPLTGEYSIPAEGTVRYQLEESSGRKRWRYVSGKLLSKQFSSATAAATADKIVPGLTLGYLPGMDIYLQLDNGNTASIMQLIPDDGNALPVYGNGVGASTGVIPAGYILHLVCAGDHWQIVNAPPGGGGRGGGTPEFLWWYKGNLPEPVAQIDIPADIPIDLSTDAVEIYGISWPYGTVNMEFTINGKIFYSNTGTLTLNKWGAFRFLRQPTSGSIFNLYTFDGQSGSLSPRIDFQQGSSNAGIEKGVSVIFGTPVKQLEMFFAIRKVEFIDGRALAK